MSFTHLVGFHERVKLLHWTLVVDLVNMLSCLGLDLYCTLRIWTSLLRLDVLFLRRFSKTKTQHSALQNTGWVSRVFPKVLRSLTNGRLSPLLSFKIQTQGIKRKNCWNSATLFRSQCLLHRAYLSQNANHSPADNSPSYPPPPLPITLLCLSVCRGDRRLCCPPVTLSLRTPSCLWLQHNAWLSVRLQLHVVSPYVANIVITVHEIC